MNGPKIFLGSTQVRRLLGKCVTLAIFSEKKQNRMLFVMPYRTRTPNAGRLNRQQNRKRMPYFFSKCDLLETLWSMQKHWTAIAGKIKCTILTLSNIDKLHIPASCKETVSLRRIFYYIFSMSPNTNGQFRPYIGIYAQDLGERRENLVSLDSRVSKYRIENFISDKPPLFWTYIRKGTVSQYKHVTRCIAKTYPKSCN